MNRRILQEIMIPARHGQAFVVKQRQVMRIIEVEGKQVGDVTFWNAHDYKETFHLSQSVALNCIEDIGGAKYLTKFYSKPPRENVMFTTVADTVKVHWCLSGGRCSRSIYALRDKTAVHRNCQDNLAEAIAPFGLTGDDVFDIFNVFMNAEFDATGCFVIHPPVSEKGDYIDMRAEMDCLVALSACPSDKVATNDYAPKSLKVEIWVPP